QTANYSGSHFETAVEVKRAGERLEGILEHGQALASTGRFFACSQPQARVESDFARQRREKFTLDKLGAATAQHSLSFLGKKLEQRLREHELKHGIAEKFETLVVIGMMRMVLQVRRVGHGPLQQTQIAERVAQTLLKLVKCRVHELALA